MNSTSIQVLLSGFLFACASTFCMEERHDNDIRLALLNGPSCAGKTSLAKSLVNLAHEKGINNVSHMSFDRYQVEVSNNSNYTKEQIAYFENKGIHIFADPYLKGIKQEIQQDFVIFYNQILEKMVEGKLVIVDHCFMNRGSFLDFLYVFRKKLQTIALIKVFCSYEIAKKRLQERNASDDTLQHRLECYFEQHYRKGSRLQEIVDDHKHYDFKLDTSDISPKEGAEDLLPFVLQIDESVDNACKKNEKIMREALYQRYYYDACCIY